MGSYHSIQISTFMSTTLDKYFLSNGEIIYLWMQINFYLKIMQQLLLSLQFIIVYIQFAQLVYREVL